MSHDDDHDKPAPNKHNQRFWIIAYICAAAATFAVVGMDIQKGVINSHSTHTTWDLEFILPALRRPSILAWNGASEQLPGNSREAFNLAFKMQVDGVAAEVRLTKDRKMILFRGNDLSSELNVTGSPVDYTQEELMAMKYRTGSNLINPDHLFEIAKSYNVNATVLLDIRTEGLDARDVALLTGRAAGAVATSGLRKIQLATSDPRVLTILDRIAYGIPYGFIADDADITVNSMRKNSSLLTGMHRFVALHSVSREAVTALRAAGKFVYAYRLPDDIDGITSSMRLGSDAVITRHIETVQKVWFRISAEGVAPERAIVEDPFSG